MSKYPQNRCTTSSIFSRMSILVFLDVNQYFSDILYNYMTRCTFIIKGNDQHLTVLNCNDSSVTILNRFYKDLMILSKFCSNVPIISLIKLFRNSKIVDFFGCNCFRTGTLRTMLFWTLRLCIFSKTYISKFTTRLWKINISYQTI